MTENWLQGQLWTWQPLKEAGWAWWRAHQISFCAGLGLHQASGDFCCISTPSERPDNAVAIPMISWNDNEKRLTFARPVLTGLPCELETQRSWIWQVCRQKRQRRGHTASASTSSSAPTWATSLCSKWLSTGSGCQQRIQKVFWHAASLGSVRPWPGAAPLGLGALFLISGYAIVHILYVWTSNRARIFPDPSSVWRI